MTRTLFTLAVAGFLAVPAVAAASLESEAVQDYEPMAVRVAPTPNNDRSFGLPNVSEFDVPPAHAGAVTITRYPNEAIQERDD